MASCFLAKMVARPYKGLDLGQGKNKEIEAEVYGGVVGVIIDARGRPLVIPEDNSARVDKLVNWYKAMDLYPLDQLRSK